MLLLRFADTYDLDIRGFVSGASLTAASNLLGISSNGLVRDIGMPRDEVHEIAGNHAGVAEVITRLHRALTDLRRF